MRSLFLRVFLSFWATISVIIVGQHLFHHYYASETGIPELLVSIALSGLPCFLLARSLATPIIRLRNASQKIARGDLTARLGTAFLHRKDEIGALVRDFDHMAKSLEDSRDAQKKLIADISHELRSPLTRLGLALEMARSRTQLMAASALDRAQLEASRLNELIGNLLLLSMLEGGANAVERTSIDLCPLVAQIVTDADFEARSRNRSVRIQANHDGTVHGNLDLLRSAIENVIRNAVRHTAERTEVLVTVHFQSSAHELLAVIEVIDHGPGVREEELSHIFRPFFRIDDARDRNTGGAGLGLSIAQRAIQFHNGIVTAHNAEGGGLVVTIEIPAVRV